MYDFGISSRQKLLNEVVHSSSHLPASSTDKLLASLVILSIMNSIFKSLIRSFNKLSVEGECNSDDTSSAVTGQRNTLIFWQCHCCTEDKGGCCKRILLYTSFSSSLLLSWPTVVFPLVLWWLNSSSPLGEWGVRGARGAELSGE